LIRLAADCEWPDIFKKLPLPQEGAVGPTLKKMREKKKKNKKMKGPEKAKTPISSPESKRANVGKRKGPTGKGRKRRSGAW
jgi:hypothetical protein